jgi:hypothetical protein
MAPAGAGEPIGKRILRDIEMVGQRRVQPLFFAALTYRPS